MVKEHITKGSKNIFADLGFKNPEEHLLKAQLALEINNIIENLKLKQQDAASLIETTQANISNLKRGRLRGFSVERLFTYLTKLGRNVEIKVKNKKKNQEEGTIEISI